MRQSRRVIFNKELKLKSIFVCSKEYNILDISSCGVLLKADFSEVESWGKLDNLDIELLLENDMVYKEFATVARRESATVALSFSNLIPIELINAREFHRLNYKAFFENPPCYIEYKNDRFHILEISHPNIIVSEKINSLAVSDSIKGVAVLLYDEAIDFVGDVIFQHSEKTVIKTKKNIESFVMSQEFGLYQNYKEKFNKIKEEKEKINKRFISRDKKR